MHGMSARRYAKRAKLTVPDSVDETPSESGASRRSNVPRLSHNTRAAWSAARLQWRLSSTRSGWLSSLLGVLATVVVVGWLVGNGGTPVAVSYAAVGLFLMTVWGWTAFRGGWALSFEVQSGTLEMTMTSRTPLSLVLLGKLLVFVPLSAPLAVVSAVIVFAIARTPPEAAHWLLLVVAVLTTLVGIVALSYFLSPLTLLVGGRGGFFNAIMPFVIVFSGFLAPIDAFPVALNAIAWLLPCYWGMEAVHEAIAPGHALDQVLGDIAVSLCVSAAWIWLALVLFRVVERRVRVTGALGGA
jgi:ABC-type uncharacterized transport system permease subunit